MDKNKQLLQKMIEDYANPDIPRKIEFTNLLEEFKNYSPDMINIKASRVYRKCLIARKINLAEKIKTKYKINNTPCDRVLSMGLAIMASKQIKK